jgi:hypothetical protein
MTKPRGGARPAWAPSSWESGEIEELDMRPYDLARRVREHTGEGLIELDDPAEDPASPPAGAVESAGDADAPTAAGSPDAPTAADGPASPPATGGTAARVEDALERFTSTIRDQIAQRAQAVGSQLVAGSKDLRYLEAELQERGFEPIASVVRRVSEGAEHIGRSLAEGDADRVAERMRELTGGDPWKIVAGGFTAGLLAARALKSYRAERPPAD